MQALEEKIQTKTIYVLVLIALILALDTYYDRVSQNPQKVLVYTKLPMAVWFVGLLFVAIGLTLIWHIAFKITETLFSSFRQG